MPAWQKARIDSITLVPAQDVPPAHLGTPVAAAGTRITVSFRPFPFSPVRMAWDAEIAEFAWHDRFCDIQLARGPFAYWRHCHSVRREKRGAQDGTEVTDRLQYELSSGGLERLTGPILVRKGIEAAFAFRQKRTRELLEEGE